MTVLAVAAYRKPRHARKHWRRVRALMGYKIPHTVNVLWDMVEEHPRAAATTALIAVAAFGLVFWPIAAVLGAAVATALVVHGADAARIASLADKLNEAERELALARSHGDQAFADLRRARAELAAYATASAETMRFAPVADGREDLS